MEAVAAIALAGNVLQFLEAGGKLSIRAFEILRHGVPGGGRSDLDDLRQISQSFKHQLEQLRGDNNNRKSPSPLAAASPLVSLSMACSETIEELLLKLDRIGVNNSHTRIDQLLEAFRSAWQKGDIESLEKRIGRFRDQLVILWISEMRYVGSQATGNRSWENADLRRTGSWLSSPWLTRKPFCQKSGPSTRKQSLGSLETARTRRANR